MPDLVKATFQNNQTALEVACRAKEWKLVSALVNAGANLDTRFRGSEKGVRVALHAACHYGAKEMVYFLLDKGADPNIASESNYDDWGWYAFPLAWATAEGDVDLVNRLLACGADPKLEGKSKEVFPNGVEIEGGAAHRWSIWVGASRLCLERQG
ncbi:hypothetical protein FA13DRAFT_1176262 [Coprinellus micaceus]|uniref:Uncharacterized protein n=1 Tax=Coprinellus micaceus TaxID=71717 RepID=A0A4Y7SVL3_COPMI|nr:hypothetical protein FA13DRAFT_1176262 [Coprinellus micaceus]